MPKETQNIVTQLLNKDQALTPAIIEHVVTTTLHETTAKQSAHIQELLVEKERLEQEIRTQTHKLQELRRDTFADIEVALQECYGEINNEHLKTLTQLQLQSIDILDLLSEITESAFIAAIENDEDTEASFREITRDLTHKTLRDGYLTLDRAQHVIGVIVSVAANLAQATPNEADEILRGAIYGTKKGLTQSINLFKEQFIYLPDQLEARQIKSMQQTFKDLHNTESIFIQTVKHEAELCETFIKEKMYFILDHMHPELSELVSISKETLMLVGEKLGKIGKRAVNQGERVLHSKAATEAKRMGVTVWDKAKGALGGAITSAKDAMDQKKQSKK